MNILVYKQPYYHNEHTIHSSRGVTCTTRLIMFENNAPTKPTDERKTMLQPTQVVDQKMTLGSTTTTFSTEMASSNPS